jgi:hypothetical protein
VGALSDVAGEHHCIHVTRVDHLHGEAKILRGVRGANLAQMGVRDLCDKEWRRPLGKKVSSQQQTKE